MPRRAYVRFVTADRHPPYGHRTGLIQAAYRALREEPLTRAEEERIRAHLDWLNEHLPRPKRLTVSRRPGATTTAVSWMKEAATEYTARLRKLATELRAFGVPCEVLRTTRPGYIVYEDEHQVAALPFRETPGRPKTERRKTRGDKPAERRRRGANTKRAY